MDKQSFVKAYFSMWKKIKDYKGTATSREYWVPFVVHLVLIVIDTVFMYQFALFSFDITVASIIGIVLFLFLLISIVPWTALCARTAHSYRGKFWWKFILFLIGIGAVIFNLIIFLGMFNPAIPAFIPGLNRPQNVYGPPTQFEREIDEDDPLYDPANNIPQDVYGPPVEEFDPSIEIPEFSEEDNIPVAIYGAPDIMNDQPDRED